MNDQNTFDGTQDEQDYLRQHPLEREPAAVFPDVTAAYHAFQRAYEREQETQLELRAAMQALKYAESVARLAADKAAVASDECSAARQTYKDASNQYD